MQKPREVVRIVLIEDLQLVRDGLRALIEGDPRLSVVGEGGLRGGAIDVVLEQAPDVVVMDIALPGLAGLDATKRILAELPDTAIVALCRRADPRHLQAAFRAGAAAFVVKTVDATQLLAAIRHVAAKERSIVCGMPAGVVVDLQPALRERLSPRECEVLELYAEAHSTKAIAQLLNLSPKTVESHRASLYRKLGCTSVVELVLLAVRERL